MKHFLSYISLCVAVICISALLLTLTPLLSSAATPIAHWTMDSGGSTFIDGSGNGNNGTIRGEAYWTSGKIGGAMQLLGGNNYGAIPDAPPLTDVQESNFTLSAWFRPHDVPPGGEAENDGTYTIISKSGYPLGLFYTNTGGFAMKHYVETSIDVGVTSGGSYAAGSYHHVVGVVDYDAGKTQIYVDGQLANETSWLPGLTPREYGTIPWFIGIHKPHEILFQWDAHGDIDDVRIYDVALTAGDISSLYTAAAAFPDPPLITPTPTPTPGGTMGGDINGDGRVDIVDLGILLTNWMTSSSMADINGDGLVTIIDLGILLSNWGNSA